MSHNIWDREKLAATGRRKHAQVAFLWIMLRFRATRWVSDQPRALGRKRIHFHGNRRLNAGVEHVRLSNWQFFKRNQFFDDASTHRSPLRRRAT